MVNIFILNFGKYSLKKNNLNFLLLLGSPDNGPKIPKHMHTVTASRVNAPALKLGKH